MSKEWGIEPDAMSYGITINAYAKVIIDYGTIYAVYIYIYATTIYMYLRSIDIYIHYLVCICKYIHTHLCTLLYAYFVSYILVGVPHVV